MNATRDGPQRADMNSTATVTMADYAEGVRFAEMVGKRVGELLIENVLIVEKNPHMAMIAFHEACTAYDAMLNVVRTEQAVPVRMGDVTVVCGYTCVRGIGIRGC